MRGVMCARRRCIAAAAVWKSRRVVDVTPERRENGKRGSAAWGKEKALTILDPGSRMEQWGRKRELDGD